MKKFKIDIVLLVCLTALSFGSIVCWAQRQVSIYLEIAILDIMATVSLMMMLWCDIKDITNKAERLYGDNVSRGLQLAVKDVKLETLQFRVKKLEEENEDLQAHNKLNLLEIDRLHKERECRLEEVYKDFVADYRAMRNELNSALEENEKLKKSTIELKKQNSKLLDSVETVQSGMHTELQGGMLNG